MKTRPLLFCVGVLLGGLTTWFLLRPAPLAETLGQPSASAPVAVPVRLPPWSWRDSPTPPLLGSNTASSAISGWLALGALDGGVPTYAARVVSLRALLLRLPAESFPQLIAALSLSARVDDIRLRAVAFGTWTTRDAASAARWAAAHGPDSLDLARDAVRVWAGQDPAAAATWACAIPDDKTARTLASLTLSTLAETNPSRALELARSRDDAFRNGVLASILQTLGKSDPAATVRTFAPELWNDGKGFPALRDVLRLWTKKDPSAAAGWITSQPRRTDYDLSNWLINLGDDSAAWRRTAADAFLTAPGLTHRTSALRNLLFNWSTSQPAEAAAWLNGLPDPELRLNLLDSASHSYLSNNPEKSLPLALIMPEGANRTQRLSQLLGAWAKINPDAAVAWMREHQVEPGVASASHAVHGALLAEIARDDPEAALADWRALPDAKARLAAIGSIAKAWGEKNPAAALKWAEQERETAGNRSYGHETELLFRWSQTQPEVALRWIEDRIVNLPDGTREFVSSHYLDALGGTWNEKAPRGPTADLYAKIKDPALRSETLTRHIREWLTKDPAGARAWLDSRDALTPAQAAALLTP